MSVRQVMRRKAQDADLDRAYARGRVLLKLTVNTEILNVALMPVEEAAKLRGGLSAKARMLEVAGYQYAEHSRKDTIVVRDEGGGDELAGVSTEELERRRDAVRELRQHAESLAEE